MIKISLIVPVYNGDKYLRGTINSLLNQTEKNFELIIVNDGSTDDTEKIATSFTRQDGRVKYIYKHNSGVSDSRNVGLSKSTGEYVVFFDADDIAAPTFLSERITLLDQKSNYGVCGSIVKCIDEGGNNISILKHAPGENIIDEILSFNPSIAACPSNLMVRKNLLTDNKISFNTTLNSSADKFFLCLLGAVTHCYSIPNCTLFYRVHSNSMSGKITPQFFADKIKYTALIKQHIRLSNPLKLTFELKSYYMLTALAFKLKKYQYFVYFGCLYFICRLKKMATY